MSAYDVTVKIQRKSGADDLAGGEDMTPSDVATGLSARLHHYSTARRHLYREEHGPGTLTRSEMFLKFVAPFPAVQINDTIVVTAGSVYVGLSLLVKTVRRYDRTMQLDVELIG